MLAQAKHPGNFSPPLNGGIVSDAEQNFTARPVASAAALAAIAEAAMLDRNQLYLYLFLMKGNESITARKFESMSVQH